MNPAIERAALLMQQSRHELAEETLRRALAEAPDDSIAHGFLALCLADRESLDEAGAEAAKTVSLAPDSDFSHYVMAVVREEQERLREAEAAILQAIRIDPMDAEYFAILARIRTRGDRWREALNAAEKGLQLDAENTECANLRALALVHLGDRDEAAEALDAALAKDPENAFTHANMGWTKLHAGEHRKAMEHFREALRLDPNMEWAREGILESLKARHFLYRILLRYFLWMSTLSGRARWGVILGAYFLYRVLRVIASTQPAVRPYIIPVLLLYAGFVYLTWTSEALFNLLLRLDPFGRLVLSKDEKTASNLVGLMLLTAIGAFGIGLATGRSAPFIAMVVCVILVIPTAGTYKIARIRSRKILGTYTAILATLGAAAVVLDAADKDAAFPVFLVFALGAFVFSLIANFLP